MTDMPLFGLIADIGGTNARFALAPIKQFDGQPLELNEAELQQTRVLNIHQYPTIDQAIADYLSMLPDHIERPQHAVMAIACPTDHDRIEMTNYSWAFNVSEVKKALDFTSLQFINDYNALANAVPHLDENGAVQIGEGDPIVGLPMVVLGPGTGLGLGALAFERNGTPVTIQTEGGHVQFAPVDETDIEILRYLKQKLERVSVERVLSGAGLENLYLAITHVRKLDRPALSAADITSMALEQQDEICLEVLTRFCSILGNYAGDAALMLGAKGGVYIAGGIVPRFLDFFRQSHFRQHFQSKGRMSGFVENIPTYVIISKQPGLLGAAAVLNHNLHNGYF